MTDLSAVVASINRFPVKGLRAEALATVSLRAGCALPHDRQFAIVHRNSVFTSEKPAWVPRRNFAVLAYSPSLACIEAAYSHAKRQLRLQYHDTQWRIDIDAADADDQLNEVLPSLELHSQPGPYTLAEVPGTALTDSPEPLISLMNMQSLKALSQATGVPLEPERFRGNIWFEGSAWEERQWPGRVLRLGGVQVKVVEEIVRCAAIDAHPQQGVRDMPLLSRLNGLYGHSHFGVLAEVLQSGSVTVGDTLEPTDIRPFGPLGI